jgi:murein DD-endopeptidase MepM/ murein hydrolase activator NlpD
VAEPIPGYVVTTPYGTPGSWAAGYHTGEDYSTHGATGKRVNATKAGKVVGTGNVWGDSYGKQVVVESGEVRHAYCHLSSIKVSTGQHVEAGDKLGESGNTGNSTGPHLHYEERHGPYAYGDDREPLYSHDQDDGDEMPSDEKIIDLVRRGVQAELGDENVGELSDRVADKVWAELLSYKSEVTQKAGPGWLVYTERRVEAIQAQLDAIIARADALVAAMDIDPRSLPPAPPPMDPMPNDPGE